MSDEKFIPPEITKKMSEITKIVSDGYHFVNMRFMMEEFERRAKTGDDAAKRLIDIVDNFHRLCVYVKERSK